jgi:exopolyphosphatase / guanosine-5'-triphosphate,3'-diphosphate pyrophosphatase
LNTNAAAATGVDDAPQPAIAKPVPGVPCLAAVDVGSNSIRLEVAQMLPQADGRANYHRLLYRREATKLGAGLGSDGRLDAAAFERGLATLGRLAQSLAHYPGVKVRAVATQTLREALNRAEFLAAAEPVLGHPIEVIEGLEEARLIYRGVHQLHPDPLPASPSSSQPAPQRLVLDVGGRSTELVLGRGGQPEQACSLAVGSQSLSRVCFADGSLSQERFDAARQHVQALVAPQATRFSPPQRQEVMASSGTAGAVSQWLAAQGLSDGRITPAGLQAVEAACLQAGHVERLALPGKKLDLKPDRRAVLPGGLALLQVLMDALAIPEIRPAQGALREGVIVALSQSP